MVRRIVWIAAICVTLAGFLGAAWLLTSDPDGVEAPPVAPLATVTLTVGASGFEGTTVTYSCPDASGALGVCHATPTNGVWSTTIRVHEGDRVDVNVHGGPTQGKCWVSDVSDQLVYTEDETTGKCFYVVPK